MHAIEFSSSSCYCFLGTCLFEIHARTIIALFLVVVSPHFSLMSLPPDNFFRQTVHKQRSLVLRLCAFGFLSHASGISKCIWEARVILSQASCSLFIDFYPFLYSLPLMQQITFSLGSISGSKIVFLFCLFRELYTTHSYRYEKCMFCNRFSMKEQNFNISLQSTIKHVMLFVHLSFYSFFFADDALLIQMFVPGLFWFSI